MIISLVVVAAIAAVGAVAYRWLRNFGSM